ncbi:toprim domain-containing protein [Pseudalkalibacillus decolorationis]|uniref:toprim domain-containing protein n=1 Tax=Pseudalkalibacillus decolorationis TaxID=163879 RepID=UPI002147DBEA|nr:toprim domain-containing protein [Pseudalkalibacillus decolorationis]
MDDSVEKVLIVEGKTDRKKIQELLKEPVDIICTNGTIGFDKMEALIDSLEQKDVYILVDEDDAGQKLRKIFKRELPNAHHLYTHRMYKEVAETPLMYLAKILMNAHFNIDQSSLLGGGPK